MLDAKPWIRSEIGCFRFGGRDHVLASHPGDAEDASLTSLASRHVVFVNIHASSIGPWLERRLARLHLVFERTSRAGWKQCFKLHPRGWTHLIQSNLGSLLSKHRLTPNIDRW